ncbi:ComF family protein [Ectopseudomonas mendocina]|uniref:ComF family protein n=1 Tax=Ectopseudomonas mendocina TaxID=300 RepID=A0ABZ2RH69_ECTME
MPALDGFMDHLPTWIKPTNRCLLCDERSEHSIIGICMACEIDLPWLGPHCSVCALPLPASGMICGSCQKRPPAFERVIAPWRYSFPVDTLITRFKHQNKLPYGHLLTELLARHIRHSLDDGLSTPDLLLPVPLAAGRLRQRGFNQAELMCQWLSPLLDVPVQKRWLIRQFDTPAQQQLDAKTRRRNLRNAFALNAHAEVKNRHIALIDDVLTTGATAEMLACLLTRAGATHVDVYCLARTPRPGD